jgi:CBS domain-containing protein
MAIDESSARATLHAFIPVINDAGRLVGIVERGLYDSRDAA